MKRKNQIPVLAIVGRPNVGKSTLFNRVSGTKKAVVLDTPGVTRDRNYEECEVGGRAFMLVDTGGYETAMDGTLALQMREQVEIAIAEADSIIFIVDRQQPSHPTDFEMAELLRKSGKPVCIAVNKCDNIKMENDAWEFYEIGIGEVFPVSALSGGGVAEMLEGALEPLPKVQPLEPDDDIIRIAVVGRQNVGKSTLVNAIIGEERVIANEAPGTTRDAIDQEFKRHGKKFIMIDTAGIRRRGKIEKGIEKISVMSSMFSMKRCDVALIILNAEEGLTEQDAHIAGYAEESGKLMILIVNKWDTIKEKDNETSGNFVKKIREHFAFIPFVPIQFISAKEGNRVGKIFQIIERLMPQYHKEIKTAEINKVVQAAQEAHSPPLRRGKRLKIRYATQTGTAPPIFTLFVNDPRLVHFSYRRYLQNKLREVFEFKEVPMWMNIKKSSTDRFADED